MRSQVAERVGARASAPEDRPWYHDGVIYEMSVRAFYDGDGDGIGDFAGLRRKLGYLHDLGVTVLWLQPFSPSPLRDDGYDASDLTGIHPAYGSLSDFNAFLRDCRRRGLRVVVELVLNHTSERHPWFQRSRRAPAGSPERDFYVWSDDPDRFKEARVLFRDSESSNWTWDPAAGAYYFHRFYAHEPDLNYDNPLVQQHARAALDFWLKTGVDGVRLDGAAYLFEREGTSCENLPENHALIRELHRHVQTTFPGRVLMTEANLWPEDAAHFFGDGDECEVVFLPALTPRLLAALRMEDRRPVVDLLERAPTPPHGGRWGLFLRSHDEVPLEAASDEERDLLVRAYGAEPQARIHQGLRRRLAPLVGNDRRQIELLNALLFSLPGTPAIYYGDELGMGDDVTLADRAGMRTPMQWSADRHAGFSALGAPRPYLRPVAEPPFGYASVNVEAQERDRGSLLQWMRRLIALRRSHRALACGAFRIVDAGNRKVLAFVREEASDRILVVANLSRYPQAARLDLGDYAGQAVVEASGLSEMAPVGPEPYPVTLGPHGFYWLCLGPAADPAPVASLSAGPARLVAPGGWSAFLDGRARSGLESELPAILKARRWFGGKAREIRGVEIKDAIRIPFGEQWAWFLVLVVAYAQGESETYALPLAFAPAPGLVNGQPVPALAHLEARGETGILFGAEHLPPFADALLSAIAGGRRFKGANGEIVASRLAGFSEHRVSAPEAPPRLLSAEQSNSSFRFGDRFMLKLVRKLETGPNPELEVGIFLTEVAHFPHTPPVCGYLEYRPARGTPLAIGVLQGFVRSESDAWSFTLGALAAYFDRVAALEPALKAPVLPPRSLLELSEQDPDSAARERLGPYLDAAGLLGRRTAELHRALASSPEDDAFAPEPFSWSDQRALHHSLRGLVDDVFDLLEGRASSLSAEARAAAEETLRRREEVVSSFATLVERPLGARRTRTHGDYHLGQVLWTGQDFAIIDFEGEPARPLGVRRGKRSPLRDVAGMLRSFHYAAYQGLANRLASRPSGPGDGAALEAWAGYWYFSAAPHFLRGYLESARGAALVPSDPQELADLLDVHLLEKAVYEVAYELNNRPDWVRLPLRGILQLLDGRGRERKG